MTKCEDAQKGINKLLDKLEQLCKKSFHGPFVREFDYSAEGQSLSTEIRVTIFSIIRMMIHYGKHLSGFNGDGPADLVRITYLETHESTDVAESEKEKEDDRKV